MSTMSRDSTTYIRHILAELDYLLESSADLDEKTFHADETLKRAFARSLEIIGEATKQLPQSLRDEHPDVPCAKMAAMRDVLIHDYFGIDYDIVWDVVENEVPTLRRQLGELVE